MRSTKFKLSLGSNELSADPRESNASSQAIEIMKMTIHDSSLLPPAVGTVRACVSKHNSHYQIGPSFKSYCRLQLTWANIHTGYMAW